MPAEDLDDRPSPDTLNLHELDRDALVELVTELSTAKAESQAEVARRLEAQEIALLGFWELDLARDQLYWDDMIYRIFEVDRAEFDASYEAFLATVHPEDREKVDAAFRASVEKRTPYEIVHRLLMPDGRIKWVHERARTTYAEDGHPVRSFGTVVDTTSAHTLQEQLQRSQRLEVVGQLTSGIAHDFNNLLTIMSGGIELALLDTPDDAPQREDLEMAAQATERCSGLVGQLLAFSRQQPTELHPLDLNAFVKNAQPILRQAVQGQREFDVALADAPVLVRADPGQLTQVLLNLCINARDATETDGHVRLTVAGDGERASLAVADDGCGMPPEVRERILEPFFTTKTRGEGTGLGMPVVDGIVGEHGGHLEIDSAPGEGTTVRVVLPQLTGDGLE